MTKDNIEKCLREEGVNTRIQTNGYWYDFNHQNLHIEFCVQSNYNGNGRLFGEMYRKNFSNQEIEIMKQVFAQESLIIIPNPEEWTENVRRYNHRRFSIGGVLENIIPELMQLINTTTEDYIAQRLSYSKAFYG
ncbi:MAG: hypothetical protein ACOC1K_05935 [Nanoarchaeota archaeon]